MTEDEERVIYNKFHHARETMWYMYDACNEAYTALIEENKDHVDINVSATGGYDDATIPLRVAMALSQRGFNFEYISNFIPLDHDKNDAVIHCTIRSHFHVTRSDRTPSIKPVFCKLPEKTNTGRWELEYVTNYVTAVENWLQGIE
jgi:hypothetical protein